MMKRYHIKIYIILAGLLMTMISCRKGFFDEINNDGLVVPATIEDMQALMDNTIIMNGATVSGGAPLPMLGESSTDDFYFPDARINVFQQVFRDLYIWKPQYLDDEQTVLNWMLPYKAIMYSNIVLDNLKKIDVPNSAKANNVEGTALFFRAYIYFHLAQVYAVPYTPNTVSALGLPMRMTSDISLPFARPSLSETYKLILDDAERALGLLPETALYKTRPSKGAVYSLLAKIYLVMGSFEKAGENARNALALHNKFLNFNTLDPKVEYPMPVLNDEVIFHINMINTSVNREGIVSDDLLKMYGDNDLRKKLYFSSNGLFTGSYSGGVGLFGGLTSSENLLIDAECSARGGNFLQARQSMERLRINRFGQNNYSVLDLPDDQLLSEIISERRRELVLRGVTWSDLRRLNQESKYARSMFRSFNNQLYELKPNSSCYTFLIPVETQYPTGTPQNVR
jgi:tetratricopeptide (TPR) repeat protein